MTCYLHFADQAAFNAAFAPFLTTDAQGNRQLPPYIDGSAVDVIGTLYKPTGKQLTDKNGLRYPEMTALDGWHVNLSGDTCPTALQPYRIAAPNSPSRTFA